MAMGMLGMGTQGAAGLSQDNINKLKSAEREAKVKPIETSLAKWEEEVGAVNNIKTKVNDLLSSMRAFDLYSPRENAFEQMSAQTQGSSANFEAMEGATVDPGYTDVDIKQVATKDVFQTKLIDDVDALIHPETKPPQEPPAPEMPEEPEAPDSSNSTYGIPNSDQAYQNYENALTQYKTDMKQYEADMEQHTLDMEAYKLEMMAHDKFMADKQMEFNMNPAMKPRMIVTVGENTHEFDTFGKTYKQLYEEMNAMEDLDVSIARVTRDQSRIAIKSAETGTENALTVSQNNVDMGFGPNDKNYHVVTAKDMIVNVDGIDYQNSSNKIEVKEGLNMTAVEPGKSSISVTRDDTAIIPAIDDFVSNYNALVDEINNSTTNPQSPIRDRSNLRMMMTQIKDILMSGYGADGQNNLFVNGFSFDKQGKLTTDNAKLSSQISNNYKEIKEMFVGDPRNMTQGVGTKMTEYLDSLDGYDGGLNLYDSNLNHRKEVLEKEKKNAIEDLDQKYTDLAAQYAAYTDVIAKMESSFKGFQNMIRG